MLYHLDKFMKKSKKFEKERKQIGNKRPNDYHFGPVRKHSIPNQNGIVNKDREDSLEYLKVPYRKEMQTSRSDRFTSERQTTKME